jgi:hypothetical protein
MSLEAKVIAHLDRARVERRRLRRLVRAVEAGTANATLRNQDSKKIDGA